MSSERTRLSWKATEVTLGFVTVGAFCTMMWLSVWYAYRAPHAPDPVTGQVFPFAYRRLVVYLSARQYYAWWGLWYGTPAAAVLDVLVARCIDPFGRRRSGA